VLLQLLIGHQAQKGIQALFLKIGNLLSLVDVDFADGALRTKIARSTYCLET
jgi:hypothetical protein